MPVGNGNLIIIARNHIDTAAALAAGSAAATLPVTNIATQSPSAVWRTTSVLPADTYCTADFGNVRYISAVSLINHNVTQDVGQWRVRLANDAPVGEVGSTAVYDSGWLTAWPLIQGFGLLPWGVFNWGGAWTEAELGERRVDIHHLLATSALAQYLRIDLSDAGNAAGYLQVGRVYAGVGMQTTVNFDRDWQIGIKDNSRRARSAGNVVFSSPRPKYRSLRLRLSWLSKFEAYDQLMELDQVVGITGDLVMLPRPDDLDYLYRHAVYGQLVRTSPLGHRFNDTYGKEYEIEELI